MKQQQGHSQIVVTSLQYFEIFELRGVVECTSHNKLVPRWLSDEQDPLN